jgi:hypothetical protein
MRPATDLVGGDGHSSQTPVAERLMRPTRAAARRCARRLVRGTGPRAAAPAAPTWSCSRWGFPCHRRCRQRGALLPHHFTLAARPVARTGSAVCFLWHCPWGRPRRALPGTVPSWSPDFPLPVLRRAAVRPSGERRCGQWRQHCQSPRPGSPQAGSLDLRNYGEPDRSGELGFDVAGKKRIDQLGRVPGSRGDCRWTGHIGRDERIMRGVG